MAAFVTAGFFEAICDIVFSSGLPGPTFCRPYRGVPGPAGRGVSDALFGDEVQSQLSTPLERLLDSREEGRAGSGP